MKWILLVVVIHLSVLVPKGWSELNQTTHETATDRFGSNECAPVLFSSVVLTSCIQAIADTVPSKQSRYLSINYDFPHIPETSERLADRTLQDLGRSEVS
tara:strand:- start:109 stop:408 length:300 start_codon:yes stop_codon:yes gene_type:complete